MGLIITPTFGWDEDKRNDEVRHYVLRVRAERESQEQPDDQSAAAARLGAPDLRAKESSAATNVVRLVDETDESDENADIGSAS